MPFSHFLSIFHFYRCITTVLASIMYIIIDRNYTNLSTISKKFTSRINEKHENVFSRPLCRTPLPPKQIECRDQNGQIWRVLHTIPQRPLTLLRQGSLPSSILANFPLSYLCAVFGGMHKRKALLTLERLGKIGYNWSSLTLLEENWNLLKFMRILETNKIGGEQCRECKIRIKSGRRHEASVQMRYSQY